MTLLVRAMPVKPFGAWTGPRNPRVVFVAEAWGQDEAKLGGQPLCGASGKEFWLMLGEAWPQISPEEHTRVSKLHRYELAWVKHRTQWMTEASIAYTNVFNLRPDGNDLLRLCGDKNQAIAGYPALAKGQYLRAEFQPELDRLYAELTEARPNLVVALGNTACWALLRTTGISALRGTTAEAEIPTGARLKILPTYHPAGVLRQWNWRPILVADLIKALGESQFPELRRPSRQILVNPDIDELKQWTEITLAKCDLLACDIETQGGLISCVGFARDRTSAAIIPFLDKDQPEWSYWPTVELERQAWNLVQKLLGSGIPLVFQNGVYDLQYLMRMGLRPANVLHDTMLLHHSLFPEMQKSLGFLGSIYTCEPAWKLMRRKRADTVKRDE